MTALLSVIESDLTDTETLPEWRARTCAPRKPGIIARVRSFLQAR